MSVQIFSLSHCKEVFFKAYNYTHHILNHIVTSLPLSPMHVKYFCTGQSLHLSEKRQYYYT